MGTVVAPGGVVVYGTGYNYPATVVGGAYVGYPETYGYGASFALGPAVGYSFGFCAGSVSTCWGEPYWGCYHWAAPSGYSYTHCNVNGCNVYTHWGTAVTATGSYGYNPYTGREWASHSATAFNPYTGAHGTVSSGAAYNPYTGNAAATRSGSAYNPATGRYVSGDTTVSGNTYNGTESRSSSGTVGDTKTGNSASWNNGNVTADKDGNIYSYNQTSGAQKYNSSTGTWEQASKPASAPAYNANAANTYASNYNAEREAQAQSVGTQRYNNYAQAGGGGCRAVIAAVRAGNCLLKMIAMQQHFPYFSNPCWQSSMVFGCAVSSVVEHYLDTVRRNIVRTLKSAAISNSSWMLFSFPCSAWSR